MANWYNEKATKVVSLIPLIWRKNANEDNQQEFAKNICEQYN